MAPRTLNATVRYRFADGSSASFVGPSCYRLSNSWRGAIDMIERECARRRESFDRDRIIGIDANV